MSSPSNSSTDPSQSSATPGSADAVDTSESDGSRGDDSDLKKCIEDAESLKREGTDHFKASSWPQALASYRSALGRLPKRPERSKPSAHPALDDDDSGKAEAKDQSKDEEEAEPLTGEDLEVAKLRSVLNANIGACHVKLGEHKEAVKACTEALLDDPSYVKALQRRASSNEQVNSWSSLSQAQEDYQKLLQILPSDSPLRPSINRSLASVKPRLEEAQKKETGEMLGKLKELGNSFLGNFGLSTDNFKFEPNGQGGYSVNFGR